MRDRGLIENDIRVADQAIDNVAVAIAGARWQLAAATRQIDTDEANAVLADAEPLPALAVSLQLWRLALECERIEREGGPLTIAAQNARSRLERAERERGMAEGAVRYVLLSALDVPNRTSGRPSTKTDPETFLETMRDCDGTAKHAQRLCGVTPYELQKWRRLEWFQTEFDAIKAEARETRAQMNRSLKAVQPASFNGTRGRSTKEERISA